MNFIEAQSLSMSAKSKNGEERKTYFEIVAIERVVRQQK